MSKAAVDTARQSIRELMKPMFAEAEDKGLWFYTSYQGLWFSPKQLRELQDAGRFLWGPVNWQLRQPRERATDAEQAAIVAIAEAKRIAAEVTA
jgi:hypothetical protein